MRNQIKKIRSLIFEDDVESVKSDLYGVFSSLILSKKIAPRNPDLEKIMNAFNFEFKEYVYKSRTTVLSRVIRIIEKMDEDSLQNLIIILLKFLETQIEDDKLVEKDSKNKKKKKNIFDDIFNQLG